MGKHRVPKEGRSLFGPRKRDNLFERSFTRCQGCGEDVYVLAEDCRECGAALNQARRPQLPAVQQPEPVRHAQPVPQAHYAQLTRQSQPVPPPVAQPVRQPQPARQPQPVVRQHEPVRQARPVHYAQLARQARLAAEARKVHLRAS